MNSVETYSVSVPVALLMTISAITFTAAFVGMLLSLLKVISSNYRTLYLIFRYIVFIVEADSPLIRLVKSSRME